MNRRTCMAIASIALMAWATAGAQNLVEWTQGPGRLGLGYPVPEPEDTPLPFDGFRSYSGLHARHQDLMATSGLVDGEIVGQTRLGRDIWAYRLGADEPMIPRHMPNSAVMYTGTIHAREWQSPEVVTGLMELITDHTDDDHWLGFVRDQVRIVVIPVLNVDGFLQTQRYPRANWLDIDNRFPGTWPRDGRMRRKNHSGADEDLFTTGDLLNGVDLNRNNPPFWGWPPVTADPVDLTYRGPQEASEPEIQALRDAAGLVPADRLRFYADMHSFARLFFSVFTTNSRRNAIQSRVLSAVSNHHAALPGHKVYTDSPGPVLSGIGATSEYFAYQYDIPALTWELEPGENNAGGEYGGFVSNGHDGFILPESEIRRVRENVAESMAVAAYHMAGPPHVVRTSVHDANTGALLQRRRWTAPADGQRSAIQRSVAALAPGREYRLRAEFSKPMRWRDNGTVAPFPGQLPSWLNVNVAFRVNGQALEFDQGDVRWLDSPDAGGYARYRDDTLELDFTIADTPANRQLLDGGGITVSIDARDLTGHRLDADPATVADYVDGAWAGYEDGGGSPGDFGGPDATLVLDGGTADSPPPFLSDPGSSGLFYDPARSGEGWVLEILDEDRAVGYWFTYDSQGNPRWLIGIGEVIGNRVEFPELQVTAGGVFGPDLDPEAIQRVPAGNARMVFTGCDAGWLEYEAFGVSGEHELRRLSRTMDLDCNPPPGAVSTPAARQSGTWYDPARSGEGFTLQWMTTGQALLTWFTYGADGGQYWIQGIGQPDGDAIHFPDLIATGGGIFGDAFDPELVERFDWGEMTLELDCMDGEMHFESVLPEFGAGTYPLRRLTLLGGLSCDAP